MYIKNLKIENFRNHKNTQIELNERINLFMGQNGQGKTNLAEAVALLSSAKSPRTHQESEMINCEADYAQIEANLVRKFGEINFDFKINKDNKSEYAINGNIVSKMSQILGNAVCIYFAPQELKIVSGSPQDRRDFCDEEISKLSGAYYNLLLRFEKVLAQRNKLLKYEKDHAKIIDTISVWDNELASVSAPIIKTRKSFIEKIEPYAQKYLKMLSNDKEELAINYVGVSGETKEEIKANILKQLDENLTRDLELGYTSVGPHRDDIKFVLNGFEARDYASRGQTRSIVLALKLAEMKIMEEELGEKPIMIFDDVFSELDNARQKSLYASLEDAQAIFTGTTFKYKPENEYSIFKIDKGQAKIIKPKTKKSQ